MSNDERLEAVIAALDKAEWSASDDDVADDARYNRVRAVSILAALDALGGGDAITDHQAASVAFKAGYVHGFVNAQAKARAALSAIKMPAESDVKYPYAEATP